jgi:DNA-binding response OmpR family regulator
MAFATILIIRHERSKADSLVDALKRKQQYTLICATSGKHAASILDHQIVDLIILDSISLRTSGQRICQRLKTLQPNALILHILPKAYAHISKPADVRLVNPSTRSVVNSVGRLLTPRNEEMLSVGPFTMNVPRRILMAHGKENQLTPKQARLVELFLRNPGTTLERKTIMSRVWDTEYMGDTRTLDVHIRWIRRVMETSNKKPRYIKTVRGVGYRLEVANGRKP